MPASIRVSYKYFRYDTGISYILRDLECRIYFRLFQAYYRSSLHLLFCPSYDYRNTFELKTEYFAGRDEKFH